MGRLIAMTGLALGYPMRKDKPVGAMCQET